MGYYDDEDYSRLELFSRAVSRPIVKDKIQVKTVTASLRAQRVARYKSKVTAALDKRIVSTRSRIAVLEETVKALEIQKAERLEFMTGILDKFGDLPLAMELTLEEARERFPNTSDTVIETTMDILGYRKISNGRGKIDAIGFERVV
jgi:hypothetical protein